MPQPANSPSRHGAGPGSGGEVTQSQGLLQDLQPLARLLLAVPEIIHYYSTVYSRILTTNNSIKTLKCISSDLRAIGRQLITVCPRDSDLSPDFNAICCLSLSHLNAGSEPGAALLGLPGWEGFAPPGLPLGLVPPPAELKGSESKMSLRSPSSSSLSLSLGLTSRSFMSMPKPKSFSPLSPV